jgi:hypothetical protein
MFLGQAQEEISDRVMSVNNMSMNRRVVNRNSHSSWSVFNIKIPFQKPE